jgi:hypothetical protein
MVQPNIPFGRFATLTSPASLPAIIVFGGLAATGRLDWGIAVISALTCTAMQGYMVRRGLGDVYRVLQFSDTLARGGTGDLPAQDMSGLFPEFTEGVTRLQQASGQDRGALDARAIFSAKPSRAATYHQPYGRRQQGGRIRYRFPGEYVDQRADPGPVRTGGGRIGGRGVAVRCHRNQTGPENADRFRRQCQP